jgi:hypothetical protein
MAAEKNYGARLAMLSPGTLEAVRTRQVFLGKLIDFAEQV